MRETTHERDGMTRTSSRNSRERYASFVFPVLTPGLHNPGLDHNREGQAPSISSPKRDSYSFPVRPKTGHA
jgi:hypothetical protein